MSPNDVSRETRARLIRFEALLRRWNTTVNLVSRRDVEHLWQRHICDSLTLASVLPKGQAIVDLGSGAGFPGLLIAIANCVPVTLVEADQRKAVFLREAARALEIDATVLAERVETCGLSNVCVLTARALAPLPRLLDLSFPLMGASGRCFFPKGPTIDAELTAAKQRWQMEITRHPTRADSGTCILEVRHLTPAAGRNGLIEP